jgi:hypothetical protein
MTARFQHKASPFEGSAEAIVDLSDWSLDRDGMALASPEPDAEDIRLHRARRAYLLRDLVPLNQEALDMRAAALAAEALDRGEDASQVSWPQARGHDLDRIADDLMGIHRKPGETDDSLRQRLSSSRRRTA